jgi:NAD(P)-dependent dehydrogenase (short-subunit alcohol dehydrogenase family)
MQVSGSSAIVVGGAGGLGEATVRRLHAAGAKVVIADLADDKGKELASELDARYVRTDATNTDDVQAALAEAESLGPLRISVDAHGGPASGGRLVGKDGSPLDLDGFKTTIDVYLTGVFNVLRLAAARDLSPLGIRVVTIAPGTFLTPAYGKAGDQLEAYWGPQVPYPKRMGRPAEYATFVQSIVENDYLNGEFIGWTARFPPK